MKDAIQPGQPRPEQNINFDIVRAQITEIKEGMPDHHGTVHDERVVMFGTYLALSEGVNSKHVELAARLHDLRWWDDEEKKARKINPILPGEKNYPSASDVLLDIQRQGFITETTYNTLLSAITTANILPDPNRPRDLITKCLADADRMSRSGVEGLLSILETNQDYGVPFHNPEDEIIRPKDSPMIPFASITSCIRDIHACLDDWEGIMETETARLLTPLLNRVNREFLKTFSQFPKAGYEEWILWLKNIVDHQKEKKEAVKKLLKEGILDDFKKGLVELEDSEVVNAENFIKFREKPNDILSV